MIGRMNTDSCLLLLKSVCKIILNADVLMFDQI